MTEYRVIAKWDADAELWVVTIPDVPGLILQGKDSDTIVEKVRLVLPALIGVRAEDQLIVTFCL
jgi:predicted RNase H-like HicB family nuclease